MQESVKSDGENERLQLELTSAEVELAPGYTPGKDGNPTIEQIAEALRRELEIDPNFPVKIKQSKK